MNVGCFERVRGGKRIIARMSNWGLLFVGRLFAEIHVNDFFDRVFI